ncbi:MAG: di-trans,poly-cis-decaprenylcistransferase [Desulfuromonas sp.]|nr:MAG: di-trans,poly-cis-decaprenylcistransferase [Desulfuromonas sp.]
MASGKDLENTAPLNHLAIIMDGNGRWAKQRGLPRIAGHRQGVEAVTTIVDECVRRGIRYLSLFAFSSENWGRPQQEVEALMALLLQFLESQQQKMIDNGIRLKVIGDIARLSASVRTSLADVEARTADGDALTLILALSYGGRDEILRGVGKVVDEVLAGRLELAELNDSYFSSRLDSGSIPDPDLLIRTSGEMRISNFLLWQLAYAELYFTDVLWPDFDTVEMQKALDDYHSRKRRFGLTDDQLAATGTSGQGD